MPEAVFKAGRPKNSSYCNLFVFSVWKKRRRHFHLLPVFVITVILVCITYCDEDKQKNPDGEKMSQFQLRVV